MFKFLRVNMISYVFILLNTKITILTCINQGFFHICVNVVQMPANILAMGGRILLSVPAAKRQNSCMRSSRFRKVPSANDHAHRERANP